VRRDPFRLGVKRAAGIFTAEHRERILLAAGVAEDFEVLVAALQQRHRRIEHDGGIDLALLHAATEVAPRPTPITPIEFGSTPFLLSVYLRKKSSMNPAR